MKWPLMLLLLCSLPSFVSANTNALGQAGTTDCDGTCSQGQATGGEGVGVMVAALGPIAGAAPIANNGSVCAMAAGSSWDDFNEYLRINNLKVEDIVSGARCTIGILEERPARFLHRVVASNPGVIGMVQQITRYLVRNGHTNVFIGLVEGIEGQDDLLTELHRSWENSPDAGKDAYIRAAHMVCTKIKGRSSQIDSLMPIYNERCLSGPLRLDNV